MENKNRILLVEDDVNLGTLLREYLIAKGFDAELLTNGEDGFKAFMRQQYDICILDVMMPRKDGFTLAQEIRTVNSRIPIIFLTAKNMPDDVLLGFKAGADDYITKPFSMQELLYRIEAILRRTGNQTTDIHPDNFTIGAYSFDSNTRTLQHGTEQVKLTTKESELLRMLCENQNEVMERNAALKAIWSDDNYFNARSMDVYITKLRKHLAHDPRIEIINVHGRGFKLVVNESK